MKRIAFVLLTLGLTVVALAQEPYSVRMIRSEMKRNPDATYLDGMKGVRKDFCWCVAKILLKEIIIKEKCKTNMNFPLPIRTQKRR